MANPLLGTCVPPYGYVYLITCAQNGKVYVGQVKTTRGIQRRWKTHLNDASKTTSKALYAAMRKYGVTSFDVQEIGQARDKKALDNLEAVYIILFKSMNSEFGYNRRAGGSTGTFSEETRKKMSESAKKKILTPEHRAKISASGKGKKHNMSEENRRKLSERTRGNKWGAYKRSEEVRVNMSGPKSPKEKERLRNLLKRVRKVWSEGDPRDEMGRFVKGTIYTEHG